MSVSNSEQQLQSARELLANRTENPAQLGSALLKIHSALENRLRQLLADCLPGRRDEFMNVRDTDWKKLVESAQQYLDLSEDNGRYILSMNYQRNLYAHDDVYNGKFTVDYDTVRNYLVFVEQLLNVRSRPSASYYSRSASPGAYANPYINEERGMWEETLRSKQRQARQSANSAATTTTTYRSTPGEVYDVPYVVVQEAKPWYRTTAFYILAALSLLVFIMMCSCVSSIGFLFQ